MRLRLDRLALLAPFASKAQRWADDNIGAIATAEPELNDRAADCWRVMLAIAERVGGEWPEQGRQAAVMLALANQDIETSLTLLLGDIRKIFADHGDELFSYEITTKLAELEERPWAE